MNIAYKILLKEQKYKDFLIMCDKLKDKIFIDCFSNEQRQRLPTDLKFNDALPYYESMFSKKLLIREDRPNGTLYIEVISFFYIDKNEYLLQFYIPIEYYNKVFNFLQGNIKHLK